MEVDSYECVGGAHSKGCGHVFEVVSRERGCPPGYRGEDCGAGDPAKCIYRPPEPVCWGCSPCGRSRRRWRCAMCGPTVLCPQCGCVYARKVTE